MREGVLQKKRIDPFLLPVCPACGGPTNLSQIQPGPSGDGEDFRTYQCAWCGRSESISVQRHRPLARAARKP
jgi:hypothetical protein